MDFSFTQEQEDLRSEARRFLEANPSPSMDQLFATIDALGARGLVVDSMSPWLKLESENDNAEIEAKLRELDPDGHQRTSIALARQRRYANFSRRVEWAREFDTRGVDQIFDVNVGNDLALFVGCHIIDLIADVHVPVNAFGCSRSGIATARLDDHSDLAHGVFFIIGVMREDFELTAIELLRPMTLLAGFLRGA